MKEEQIGKPVIAVVNSFTQFVPGHTHLHEIGQFVKQEIEKLGCFAAEFNTIAIDDGIAMGHDGMLYSLPSRDLIADSVEYMVNAHKADAMVCISNCDKITPGMLMAAMRLNIPAIFVSGGPMEAGHLGNRPLDLIDVMIDSADTTVDDATVTHLEQFGCPTCGSCSGMFTANSMNCLNEAIGLALPGNGTILATHTNRKELFRRAAAQIVENCRAYYFDDDASVLPRSIATRQAMLNAMTLDIAMGGSTNTVSRRYGGKGLMKQLKAEVEQKGWHWVDWNVCAEDAVGGHPSAGTIYRNVVHETGQQTNCIVLMHDSSSTHTTAEALPDIIRWYADNGYTFLTVAEALPLG